jgi:5-methylthioribose kinase
MLIENPEDLTTLAQQRGWLPDGSTISNLTKAGEGNMNKVMRASVRNADSGDVTTIIFKQSLPYVAKFPDIPAPIERIASEHRFYQAVAERPPSQQMPELIGYAEEHHLLCFEDVGEGRDLSYLYKRGDEQTIPHQTLLTWLSQLHRLPIDTSNHIENIGMRQLNHEHIFNLPFKTNNGLSFGTAVDNFRQSFLTPVLVDTAQQLGQMYLGKTEGISSHCLLHGDYYPGSWLAHPTVEVMIIDPEFTFVGPGEFDVGVYLAHLVMAGLSKNDIAEQLKLYSPPHNYNPELAWQFAGIEIIRRILGVAQLPLNATDEQKVEWLKLAQHWVLQSN